MACVQVGQPQTIQSLSQLESFAVEIVLRGYVILRPVACPRFSRNSIDNAFPQPSWKRSGMTRRCQFLKACLEFTTRPAARFVWLRCQPLLKAPLLGYLVLRHGISC